MSGNSLNKYKSSRISAGITQEYAAEMLGIAVRTLYDYENGNTDMPKNIAERMAVLYKNPALRWEHAIQYSSISKYLPDIEMPTGNGEMAFQLICVKDDIEPTVTAIKEIMRDRRVDDSEKDSFREQINNMWNAAANLISVILYAEQLGAND